MDIQPTDLPTTRTFQRLAAAVSMTLGYVWRISGINKLSTPGFVKGFGDYVKSSVEGGRSFEIYARIMNSVVAPRGDFFGYMVEFSEVSLGIALLSCGIWQLFKDSRWASIILCIANLGSFLMILNIILSTGMKLPWIQPYNAYASGVSVEYVILFISIFLSVAYFQDFTAKYKKV